MSARRACAGVAAFATALLGALFINGMTAQPAQAAVSPIAPRPASAITADPLPTVQIDGVVWSQAVSGNKVYVGGSFSNARPAGAAAGTNLTPRANLLAYDITTGNLDTSFNPSPNGQVKAVAVSPDKTRVYIGGQFTTIAGQTRYRIAAFSTATGALISSFAPVLGSTVTAIAATDDTVYVGGWFGVANGNNRTRLAAFRATDGALLSWAPSADDDITSMVLTPNGAKVVVGGSFRNINGQPNIGIASVNASTGAVEPWPVNTVIKNGNTQSGTYSLSADNDTVYGTSYNFGDGNFEGEFAMNQDGSIKWLADCHGDTYAAISLNNVVYGAGHSHFCSNIGGWPEYNPRVHKHLMAFTKDATGTVLTNSESGAGYGNFAGQPSPSIIDYFPDFTTGTYTGQSQAVWSLAGNANYVSAGGEFPTAGGVAQQGLVRFAVTSIAPNKVKVRDLGGATNPTVAGIGGYGMRVSWKLNWDPDDMALTYKVVRQDKGTSAPLSTSTINSTWWQRPIVSFVDKTAQPGQTYNYRIYVTDAAGNGTNSDWVSATMPSGTISDYGKAVMDDGATNYWPLDDANQTTLADIAGGNALTKQTGITSVTPGALSSGAAASFNGSAVAGATSAIDGPQVFTVETWIKTTTNRGGKILGFGNQSTSSSSSYDRHIYMDNAGHITFGVYTGATRTVTTSGTYNDGQWHQIAASLSSSGMTLWVDGIQRGSDASTTSAQSYTGYWRLGGDNLGGWPNTGSKSTFTGQIDETAIYPTALTATQIRDHYTKSGRTLGIPSAPADTYGKTVYGDNPVLYWRLDDQAGPTIADSGTNLQPGVAAGGVTYRAASTVTSTGTGVQFDGATGTLASKNQFTNPTVYSLELWFKTTTTHGGKLIGFGNAQSGTSSSYDRHVYMENSGQLTFGTYTGTTNITTSQRSYNDGAWHQVIATQGSDGMKLYVDGQLVGTNAQTAAQSYSGYWRVGGDTVWSGDSNFFAGTIDEAAVYSGVLSQDQVRTHYFASPAAVNAAPVAAFTPSCTEGDCSFDASASSDSDGTVASYSWDFGDGSAGTGKQTTHSYTASGTYTVKLTVTDDRGNSTSTSKDVAVSMNQAPTAAFTSSCTERACSFDGSASTDADGSIATYGWDFGDGSSSQVAKPDHTYSQDGTYTVALTVTDNQGKTDVVKHDVTVHANQKPTAAFTADSTELAISVDASASSDPDGSIASYAWDFGDGSSGAGKTASHTYAAAGDYQVKLTVTDNDGATDTLTKTVTVAMNVKPVAAFTAQLDNLAASFDASGSNDPDGSIASYAWDFGDGASDTGKTASHTYAAAGDYQVKLTVTDNDGATDSITKTVTASEPPAGTILAQDDFNRTTTRWGTADTGGAWTYSAGASAFSTDGNSGNVTLTAGSTATASLDSVSAADFSFSMDVSVNKVVTGGGANVGVIGRKINNSYYSIKVRYLASGVVHLVAARTVNGSETVIREINVSNLTYAAGDVIHLDATMTGTSPTTLTATVWKDGTTKPATPQLSETDSTTILQSPGAVGVACYLGSAVSNGPLTISIDNLVVKES